MTSLRLIEEAAYEIAMRMEKLTLAEAIGMQKQELSQNQAFLKGYQRAMKVKLNTNPPVTP